jgi:hypothetical protein
MEPNGIQEVACSIHVSSTNKIKGLVECVLGYCVRLCPILCRASSRICDLPSVADLIKS